MASILSLRNLSTGYGKKQVLFDVSLDVMPGEILLLIGGNGSGKSTLLKAIYGLLPPWNHDAKILFRPTPDGPSLSTQPAIRNLSNGLAYLPQKNAVFDDLTVEDNLRIAGHTFCDRHEFSARRDEAIESLPALKPLLRRKAEKMSGGERQMTALAMVLLHRPRLLLLDEPTAGLAVPLAEQMLATLSGLRSRHSTSVLIVEHRVSHAVPIADRTLALRLGRINVPPIAVDELPSVATSTLVSPRISESIPTNERDKRRP